MSSKTIENLWDNSYVETLTPHGILVYRSNLLGSNLSITNYGGGNTSSKLTQFDPLTKKNVKVLWVKGSGGDLGTIKLDGFSTLYMEKLEQLQTIYRGIEYEDEMVGYLPHCTFNLNPRVASIDTPLHAFIPYTHVDHMHPDAIIAIACTTNSKELTKVIFEGQLGWLPWQRPGFDLGLQLKGLIEKNPNLKGILLEGHGLFTWGNSSKECYENTINTIAKAQEWLNTSTPTLAFGGYKFTNKVSESIRKTVASKLMPILRGKITGNRSKVGHFNDSNTILEFVGSKDMKALAQLGTSCPDHFLRTKICPLVLDFNPDSSNIHEELNSLVGNLDTKLKIYQDYYSSYYKRCKNNDSPAIRDNNAIVYLIPGIGMITFAKDKSTAKIAGEFYVNAVNVMRGASAIGTYQGLNEKEAFNIEYWSLEEAKLQRMPKAKSLSGKIAFITGGAGGIGKATAKRLLKEGCCVVLADIDLNALDQAKNSLLNSFNPDCIRIISCDVTKENDVINAIKFTAREFGGLDILICNAGIASSAPLEETTLEMWNFNMSILSTGYFLTVREGFKLLTKQHIGGSIVFIASKNGLVASPNASAYCTAKASEIQLSRGVALEGAALGIRCNVINPDAVLRGSKIWDGKWREERAAAYKMDQKGLEEHYRKRSLLKRNVFPEDIAEAAYFLASDLSAKSTGNIINVDAGHAPSFTR
jgi:rhamnulose-1-phosphate aldolase/alcohol dehydrogenase